MYNIEISHYSPLPMYRPNDLLIVIHKALMQKLSCSNLNVVVALTF